MDVKSSKTKILKKVKKMAKKQVSSSSRRARVVGELESSESSSGRRAPVVGELEWLESSSGRRTRVAGELQWSESSGRRRARVVGELEWSESLSRRRARGFPGDKHSSASCIYIFSGMGSGLRIITHSIICAQYTICGMLRNAIVVFSPGGVSLCR